MQMFSIRGATTIEKDTVDNIEKSVVELMQAILDKNGRGSYNIVNIVISSTADIKSFYPARALRESGLSGNAPLFSCAEPEIDGSLRLCIRFMVQITTEEIGFLPKHVYMNGAKGLRADLIDN